MNAIIPTLLIFATVVFAPQNAAQKTNQPEKPVGSTRVPVDVSLQSPGDTRGGIVSVTPSVGSVRPLGFSCAPSIRDQAGGGCLQASSTPTLGRLYPLSPNFNINAAGNVGIGTTIPQTKLQVNGTIRIETVLDNALDIATGSIYKGGTLFLHDRGGTRNTALGLQALANITTGFSNTATGYRALASNTTGDRNTASGDRALTANTTGVNNTASGVRALYSNTTGFGNTASGFRALYSNMDGSLNTATGVRALDSNTTGGKNTANGYEALRFNTAGNYNTAEGERVLWSNTTGISNTASGARALFSNTIGNFNTATGRRALYANTTGDFNTASGALALDSNTTGGSNTVSGSTALRNNTSGSGNTAVGVGALYSNTIGNNNIAIGNYAGGYLTTGNDNIAIGNSGDAGEANTIRIGSVQTRTFVAGIRGVTTGFADAIPVLVDSAGQLGTISSARRFKEDIRDMGDTTSRLLELRPVIFHYKQEVQSGKRLREYGLIAEEVAEVFPELVVYDEEGRPETVKYRLLSSMLLNELKKHVREKNAETEENRAVINELLSRQAVMETQLAALTERLED